MTTLRPFAAVAVLATLAPAQQPQVPSAGGQGAESHGPAIVVPGLRKLTIGGQYRLRYEAQRNYDFDDDRKVVANQDFFTQRARLGFDFDFGEELRVFLQLQDAREWGEEASTVDDSADGFDLHQGYVDLRRTPGIGGSTRIGRQEINLGDQRLVGALDWRTGARSLDGALQTWKCEDGALLAWAVQGRETIGALNDDLWFGGLYGTRKFDAELTGDLYLMYLHDDGIQPMGAANRFTLGTRWIWGPAPWEFGTELATQFGEQGTADIPIADTWAGHVHVMRRFDGDWQPWLKLAFDAASGDDPATADNERFNNLFPTAHAHWGMMDLAQWENLFNPWAQIGVTPCQHTDVALAWHYFRSMEAGDVLKGPNGTLSPGGVGFSRTMGHEIDLLVTRNLQLVEGVKTALQFGYGVFLPGPGVEDARGTDDLAHFVYAQFDVKF